MPPNDDAFSLLQRARELRRMQTAAEKLLWEHLRARRLDGLKFRRQVPLLGHIADFYCHELALVVEVDGEVHSTAEQRAHDENRDADLAAHGLTVLRFSNRQVLGEIETVKATLRAWLKR